MSALQNHWRPMWWGPQLGGTGLILLALALSAAADALAQYPLGQEGRLFDANPQLGGSRYNFSYGYHRPMSPLVGGNPFASGNMGRGLSLRSISPISSPTAFRAGLGSGALSNFRRDSVSVADRTQPLGGLRARHFFDPVRTAPTGGYLQGFYRSGPAYPGYVPGRQDIDSLLRSSSRFDVLDYGTPPAPAPQSARLGVQYEEPKRPSFVPGSTAGSEPLTPLLSTIFGPQPPRLPDPFSGSSPWTDLARSSESGRDRVGVAESRILGDEVTGPLDLRLRPEQLVEPLTPTPLGVIAQEEAMRMLTEPGILQLPPLAATAEETADVEDAVPQIAVPGAPGLLDTGMMPGSDVFTDMQLALALAIDPQADWFGEMQSALQQAASESPALSVELQDRAVASAEEFISRVLDMPVHTFVGEVPLAINEELQKAEAAMEGGDYYDAVRHYERAHLIDPANPLPLIGKGHALVASGEYVSAAFSLIRGLERFPQLTRFQLDLTTLIGGGEIVDIRRADLMQRLARHEDPELRFLLGYLEVHTGNREFGMQNLDKAAEEADPRSFIRQYPALLRSRGMPLAPTVPAVEIPEMQTPELPASDKGQSLPGKEPE